MGRKNKGGRKNYFGGRVRSIIEPVKFLVDTWKHLRSITSPKRRFFNFFHIFCSFFLPVSSWRVCHIWKYKLKFTRIPMVNFVFNLIRTFYYCASAQSLLFLLLLGHTSPLIVLALRTHQSSSREALPKINPVIVWGLSGCAGKKWLTLKFIVTSLGGFSHAFTRSMITINGPWQQKQIFRAIRFPYLLFSFLYILPRMSVCFCLWCQLVWPWYTAKTSWQCRS